MNTKFFRKSKKVSQRELAQHLNVSRTTYQSYENGRNEPNIDTLIKMADFFGVSVDTLIGHDNHIVDLQTVSKNQKYVIDEICLCFDR